MISRIQDDSGCWEDKKSNFSIDCYGAPKLERNLRPETHIFYRILCIERKWLTQGRDIRLE